MKAPKDSFLKDGVRYCKVSIDIMVNNGQRYYATFRGNLRMQADLSLGMYHIPLEDLRAAILQRYPTLKNRQYNLMFN